MTDLIVMLVTAPKDKAGQISEVLARERLAACTNIVPGIRSIYWWEGKMQDDTEDLIIIKTKKCLLGALVKRLREIHPYEISEIVALQPLYVLEDYEKWALRETLSCQEE
jgi:periplasmic divalent cation tolerance protein